MMIDLRKWTDDVGVELTPEQELLIQELRSRALRSAQDIGKTFIGLAFAEHSIELERAKAEFFVARNRGRR